MKNLVLTAFLMSSTVAMATTPTVYAYKTTCAKLKAKVENYKEVIVVSKKVGLFKKRTVVSEKADCGSDETKQYGSFKTVDKKFCAVGEWCKQDSWDSSYSGGYSDSSYDSGSSYSSGSSYDSGSSSSSGSNYNPPSSSYEGPSYNPPSSGTRGSNYCPGCAL